MTSLLSPIPLMFLQVNSHTGKNMGSLWHGFYPFCQDHSKDCPDYRSASSGNKKPCWIAASERWGLEIVQFLYGAVHSPGMRTRAHTMTVLATGCPCWHQQQKVAKIKWIIGYCFSRGRNLGRGARSLYFNSETHTRKMSSGILQWSSREENYLGDHAARTPSSANSPPSFKEENIAQV
jgi:hypothetical protein